MKDKQIPLGTYLRELREKQDMSLRELARNVDISPAFLSDVELNRRHPTDEMFARIAKELKVSVEKLKEFDTRPPIDDIRERTQSDPTYAYALRRALKAGVSSEDFLELAKRREQKQKNK